MRRRFFLMYNASAGTARADAVERVATRLVDAGATVVRSKANTVEAALAEATNAAHSGAFDAIVTAGGDGTVRQAVIAARGTRCPVGALMIGTGNVLAHELALPRDADGVAHMLLSGATLEVELGRANGVPFLLMVGAGLDGRIVQALNQPLKQRVGKAAYVPAALSALAAPLDRVHIEIDGAMHTCTWAIVTSAERYGGHFRLTQATSLKSPGFAALLFHAKTRSDLVAQAIALARGQLDVRADLQPEWVAVHHCRTARLTAAPNVPVQIDGDTAGTTPVEIDHDGGRVMLIVPQV